MQAENLVMYLGQVKKTHSGWMACCPAHDDRSPSLAIKQANDRILMHCFAGCSVGSIIAALGLNMGDLFSSSNGFLGRPKARDKELIRRVLYNEIIFSAIYEKERHSAGKLSNLDSMRLTQAKARVVKAREIFNEIS